MVWGRMWHFTGHRVVFNGRANRTEGWSKPEGPRQGARPTRHQLTRGPAPCPRSWCPTFSGVQVESHWC